MMFLATTWALPPVDRDLQGFDLDHLAGIEAAGAAPIRSRHIQHPDHQLATEYLWARLNQIPQLRTHREAFEALGLPATNLVAILPGSDPSLEPIVIGAHYDSTGSLDDDWDPTTSAAPGADDNASGCAALLEVARQMANEPGFQRTIEFIFFDAEEEGLLGSAYHVSQRSRGVHAMISVDPVGANVADFGWIFAVVGEGASHIEQAYVSASESIELSTIQQLNVVQAGQIGPPRSDHGPFMEAGFPALHLSTFPPPPGYHTQHDTRDTVDPGFLADATAMTARVLEELAMPNEPKGCATVSPFDWATLWMRRRYF